MQYTVEMMSRVLAVSASGFYKWLKANPLKDDAVASIKDEIATVYKNQEVRTEVPESLWSLGRAV